MNQEKHHPGWPLIETISVESESDTEFGNTDKVEISRIAGEKDKFDESKLTNTLKHQYKSVILKKAKLEKYPINRVRLILGEDFRKKISTGPESYTEKGVEILKSCTQLATPVWESLSMEERSIVLSDVTKAFARMLEVPVHDIKLEPMDIRMRGYYDRDGYIHINRNVVNYPDLLVKAITAIIHELRHAYQLKAIHDPSYSVEDITTIQAWRDNFNHYLKAEDGLERYWKQPVEADARKFSEEIVSKWRGY